MKDRNNTTIQPSIPRPKLQSRGLFAAVMSRVFLVIAIYTLINLSTARYRVEGISMQPALQSGDMVMVSRVHYLLQEPQRGDIVVLHLPQYDTKDYIKRIIALPGDTLEIRADAVYVNGVLLQEAYVTEACTGDMCDNRIWQLASNEYFVMGDNRNYSSDSRSFGAIKKTNLTGKVFLRYGSLQHTGFIN